MSIKNRTLSFHHYYYFNFIISSFLLFQCYHFITFIISILSFHHPKQLKTPNAYCRLVHNCEKIWHRTIFRFLSFLLSFFLSFFLSYFPSFFFFFFLLTSHICLLHAQTSLKEIAPRPARNDDYLRDKNFSTTEISLR